MYTRVLKGKLKSEKCTEHGLLRTLPFTDQLSFIRSFPFIPYRPTCIIKSVHVVHVFAKISNFSANKISKNRFIYHGNLYKTANLSFKAFLLKILFGFDSFCSIFQGIFFRFFSNFWTTRAKKWKKIDLL